MTRRRPTQPHLEPTTQPPDGPRTDALTALERTRHALAELEALAGAANIAAVLPPRTAPEFDLALSRLVLLVAVVAEHAEQALDDVDGQLVLLYADFDAPF